MVLFDQNIWKCVWAVELLLMDDEKWKFLFFWPNPNENILQKVNEEDFYNKIKEIIIDFAKDNDFDWILTDIWWWMATNSTWKFYNAFKNSIKWKMSLNKEYHLWTYYGEYNFQKNLNIIY